MVCVLQRPGVVGRVCDMCKRARRWARRAGLRSSEMQRRQAMRSGSRMYMASSWLQAARACPRPWSTRIGLPCFRVAAGEQRGLVSQPLVLARAEPLGEAFPAEAGARCHGGAAASERPRAAGWQQEGGRRCREAERAQAGGKTCDGTAWRGWGGLSSRLSLGLSLGQRRHKPCVKPSTSSWRRCLDWTAGPLQI